MRARNEKDLLRKILVGKSLRKINKQYFKPIQEI